LSGRRLKLNDSWTNPSQEWRVGMKRVYELFTDPLVKRMKMERRKDWDRRHREVVTTAVEALAAFDVATPSPKDAQKKERLELENRIKVLKELAETYEDPSPMLDCVVWHDGSKWRAAIDSSELYTGRPQIEGSTGGQLAACKALADFDVEREYGTFSPWDACNYGIHVYDEGKVLSIITDSSPHGTHVAGITAAYHPEDPDLNGVAPGAQIISCKIGDSRLDGMESGVGCTRAIIAVIRHKCHLINMSYGEPAAVPNKGRFIDLANEVVHKHNAIFVSSAVRPASASLPLAPTF
ncbi:tripeptidyl-peptidase II Tpp2, partial [Cymbomonas tetramitiformis]